MKCEVDFEALLDKEKDMALIDIIVWLQNSIAKCIFIHHHFTNHNTLTLAENIIRKQRTHVEPTKGLLHLRYFFLFFEAFYLFKF